LACVTTRRIKDDPSGYLTKIRTAASALIKGGYLLQEDLDNVVARARAHWEYAHRAAISTAAE
jgi:hypothetical protein